MAQPMISTAFKNEVSPILATAFDGVYDQRDDEHKRIFTTRNSPVQRNQYLEPVLYGFQSAPEIPEGQPITYDVGGELFMAKYLFRRFGLAFALTNTLVEDGEHVSMGTVYSEHLAQSLVETKELRCANVLNRAFNSSYVGGDAVSLIANNHPIGNGGTFSNLLTVSSVLSQTSFEQLLIQIRNAVNNTNMPVHLKPKQLVVNPANMYVALAILKSVGRTGTANNDINPIKYVMSLESDPVVLTRLTSTIAWFVKTDAPRGLQVIQRKPLKKGMEGDFDTDSMRYKAQERYIEGWTDPRTLWGSAAT